MGFILNNYIENYIRNAGNYGDKEIARHLREIYERLINILDDLGS
jgi:hypothetical protein